MEVEDLTGYSMFMAAGTVKEDLVQCSASIMMGVHKVLSLCHVFEVLYVVSCYVWRMHTLWTVKPCFQCRCNQAKLLDSANLC